jgi:hypothetical protein
MEAFIGILSDPQKWSFRRYSKWHWQKIGQTRRHSKFQSVAIVIKGIRYWKENFSKTMGQFSIQKKQRPSKSVVLISIWFCIRHSCGLKQLYILKYFSSLILNKTNIFSIAPKERSHHAVDQVWPHSSCFERFQADACQSSSNSWEHCQAPSHTPRASESAMSREPTCQWVATKIEQPLCRADHCNLLMTSEETPSFEISCGPIYEFPSIGDRGFKTYP